MKWNSIGNVLEFDTIRRVFEWEFKKGIEEHSKVTWRWLVGSRRGIKEQLQRIRRGFEVEFNWHPTEIRWDFGDDLMKILKRLKNDWNNSKTFWKYLKINDSRIVLKQFEKARKWFENTSKIIRKVFEKDSEWSRKGFKGNSKGCERDSKGNSMGVRRGFEKNFDGDSKRFLRGFKGNFDRELNCIREVS